MRILSIISILVGLFMWAGLAYAEMTSTNYQIQWDTIGQGGDDMSDSASYQLRDTIGNSAVGSSDSTNYSSAAGYRQGVFDQILTFEVYGQGTSQKDATALTSTTITCDTSGISEGDFIALVQDEGESQVSAVGRVTTIGAGTITVDDLQDGGVVPTIDGVNDYVYLLNTTSVDLNELDPAEFSTTIIGFDVSADLQNGYVIQVYEDGNLRDGSDDIDDVSDGAVSLGAEEYGARSSDTSLSGSLFDTEDSAFMSSYLDVADESSTSFDSRNFLTLKASIDATTADGTYEHTLTFILSGNF